MESERPFKLTEDSIKAWLKEFTKGDLFDMEFRKKLINCFINHIMLEDDRVTIYYNIQNSKHLCIFDPIENEPPEAVRIPTNLVDYERQYSNLFISKGLFGFSFEIQRDK